MPLLVNKNGAFAVSHQPNPKPKNNKQPDSEPPKPRENSWGQDLLLLNNLTGDRPTMAEAPPSKKAKKLRAEGKPKKSDFKVSKFIPHDADKKSTADSQRTREQVKQLIKNVLDNAHQNSNQNANEEDQMNDQNQPQSKENAVKTIFYLFGVVFHKRDIIDGAGERSLSYYMLLELYKSFPETTKKLLKNFAFDWGSLVDLNKLACLIVQDLQTIDNNTAMSEDEKLQQKAPLKDLSARIVQIFVEAFESRTHETLAGKWAPRQGKHVDRITNLSFKIAEKLFPPAFQETDKAKERSDKKNITLKLYRQKLTVLNSESTEAKLCAKEYSYLADNLEKIPGKALAQYRYALLDIYRYGQLKGQRRKTKITVEKDNLRKALIKFTMDAISKARSNPANPNSNLTLKAKTLQPYEIIRDVWRNQYLADYEVNPVHEAQWEVLKARTKEAGRLQSTVVMADVSGSMQGLAMEVSISLAILISEIQTGCWSHRVMTFAEEPAWFTIPKNCGLKPKVRALSGMDWGGSADLGKSLDLILGLAVENNVLKKDMPQNFIILTDMNFQEALNQPVFDFEKNQYKTEPLLNFDGFKKKFEEAGYDMPVIILWNLQSKEIGQIENQQGVLTLGGFSISLFKSILQGDQLDLTKMTATDMLLDSLSKPKYDAIYEEIKAVGEVKNAELFEKWDFEAASNYKF